MAYTTFLSDSTSCWVNQVFGGGHRGTDITFQPPNASNICAPKAGTVSVAQNGGAGDLWTYGWWVEIAFSDGAVGRFAHMSSISVLAGDIVTEGQKIGVQGTTGNSSGIHLHIEYFVGGVLVSPAPLMGFPDSLGYYELTFGSPNPIDPPDPKPPGDYGDQGYYWGEIPDRKTEPRHFEFQATLLEQDEAINTVDGEVQAKKGDWIIQPRQGLCDWKLMWTPRKTVHLEIPKIVLWEGGTDSERSN